MLITAILSGDAVHGETALPDLAPARPSMAGRICAFGATDKKRRPLADGEMRGAMIPGHAADGEYCVSPRTGAQL